MTHEADKWTVIKPKNSLLALNLGDVWRYRDLVRMFVVRDFVTLYKQTILGPLWFIIQPLFTSGMYFMIFGRLAQISTDGVPELLFYMAGVINWGYFAECLGKTADTFTGNASVFGKVYFPRLTVPVTNIVTGMLRYAIQFTLFLVFYFIFLFKGANVSPNWMIALTPVLLIYSAVLATGYGLWISAVTTKYRDLRFALPFVIQLWMYATPVVYPLSLVPDKYKMLMVLNPIAPVIEIFRMAYLGAGTINLYHIGLSALITLLIAVSGIVIFNKTEKTFMDTV
ncbi:MAG: ABC transporter permease [Spirochaetales bacterium]|jgi:lipopolysaccharide transport system permease protein|nr:ABC transporter permease [Spirochaetales bacterium]